MESHPKWVQMRTGEKGVKPYELTLSLFMFLAAFLSYVFLFICGNLTLTLFKKDVFVRNDYFTLARSISVVVK